MMEDQGETRRSGGPHDVGGDRQLFAPLDTRDRPFALWEKRMDAVENALTAAGLLDVNRLRHGIEKLPPSSYANFSYYGKWAAASLGVLLEDGVLRQCDVEAALGAEADCDTVLFRKGQRVRVKREEDGGLRWRKPHLRVPGYIFGCSGVVERVCGVFPNPEAAVFGSRKQQPLYRVRFDLATVWRAYEGHPDDTCDVEIYQHWLEGVEEGDRGEGGEGAPCVKKPRVEEAATTHHHSDGTHGHSHSEHADHGGHVHESRSAVEQTALERESEESPDQRLADALYRTLISKKLISAADVQRYIDAIDSLGTEMVGPKLVARAWTDPAFKELLLRDAAAACASVGVNASNTTAKTVLTVVENTDAVHNLVVCTLCSCYPRSILGLSPDWYKSRSYRARAVLEPRSVLAEFGTEIPKDCHVAVHDSTADLRYFVLPQRPRGTEGWSMDALASLVTRDSMIGVTRLPDHPTPP